MKFWKKCIIMARTGFLSKFFNFKKNMNKSFSSFRGNFSEANSTVKREIHFDGKEQFYIEINPEEGEVVRFEFTYPLNDTKLFKFSQENFTESEIILISNNFNLSLRNNPYSKRLTCSIPGLSEDYGYAVYGAEVNTNKGTYLCIFAKKGQSIFVDNIYFINGIYKIAKSFLQELELQ